MSDALAGAYQGRFGLRACGSRSAQSKAILGGLVKGPPGELFPFIHCALHGVAVEKELFTLAA